MANTCIFCGQTLKRFGQKSLLCGNIPQPVCDPCRDKLFSLSQEERGQLALETGRAINPEAIRTYLEQKRQAHQKKRQSIMTGKTCLRCGGQMLNCGRKIFQLGSEGLSGLVARDGLFADFLEADILRCEVCGKGEFFIPDDKAVPPVREEAPEQVACPVCGTRHSSLTGCPACAMGNIGRPEAAPSGQKAQRKPPWEK